MQQIQRRTPIPKYDSAAEITHEYSLAKFSSILSMFWNLSWGSLLNGRDLKKMTKIFNCFVDLKMVQEIEMFKVAEHITINAVKTFAEKIYRSQSFSGKVNAIHLLTCVLI